MVSSSAGIARLSRRGGCGSSKAICRSNSCRSSPAKAGSQRQQLVQRRPQRVDVGAVVDHHALGQRLLGAHVAQRADQVAGHRQPRVALHLGQAEVRHPQAAGRVHQQVGRLDVAVDDAQLVGVVQRLGRLDAPLGHAAEVGRVARRRARSTAAARGAVSAPARRPPRDVRPSSAAPRRPAGRCAAQLGDDGGQGLALDELHGVVVDAALAADGVDRHDVGVVQAGRGPRLVVEALQAAAGPSWPRTAAPSAPPAGPARSAPPRRRRPCRRGPPRGGCGSRPARWSPGAAASGSGRRGPARRPRDPDMPASTCKAGSSSRSAAACSGCRAAQDSTSTGSPAWRRLVSSSTKSSRLAAPDPGPGSKRSRTGSWRSPRILAQEAAAAAAAPAGGAP